MTVALAALALGLVLLAVALRRAAVVLYEAEATLRSLVTEVRAVRRAVRGAAALAGEVGSSAAAGEAELERLEGLKAKRRNGPQSATVAAAGGAGAFWLPLRPHPRPAAGPPPPEEA